VVVGVMGAFQLRASPSVRTWCNRVPTPSRAGGFDRDARDGRLASITSLVGAFLADAIGVGKTLVWPGRLPGHSVVLWWCGGTCAPADEPTTQLLKQLSTSSTRTAGRRERSSTGLVGRH
jgi:hypothetical protein